MLLLGSLLVVGGVYFLSLRNEKNDPQDSAHLRRGILVALFAAVLWGLSATLLKPATANMDIVHANATRMPLIALIVYLARVRPSSKETLRGVSLKSFAVVGFAGALGMGLSAYLFIYAIGEIGVAKVVTLSSISPLFGMAMAVVFLKEKVTWQVMVGVGLCLAGVWTVI
jgi:transporter family protein